MSDSNKKSVNIFKWLFLLLLLINIIVVIYGVYMVNQTSTGQVDTEQYVVQDQVLDFNISATKDDITSLANTYLTEATQDSFVGYQFDLNEYAEVHGQVEVLFFDVNFSIYFEPQVLDNGNVVLNAERMSIGNLDLPISLVLEAVKNQVDLPDFISIDSEEEFIAVNINELTLDNGVHFSVESINLPQDDININIHIPVEIFEENAQQTVN